MAAGVFTGQPAIREQALHLTCVLRIAERKREGHLSNGGWRAARGLVCFVRYAPVLAVHWHGIERMKRFPSDSLRVVHPGFISLGLAACSLFLFKDWLLCCFQSGRNKFEGVAVVNLDAQMIQPWLPFTH